MSKHGLFLASLGFFVTSSASAAAPVGPWDLAALKAAPAVSWLDAEGPVRRLYYAGEPYRGRPTRVFAYYAVPEKVEGKLPVMVLVHGGGGKAFRDWAELWAARGYAAIAMDLAGKGPDGQPLPDGGPDQGHEQKFDDIAGGVRNAWPYHAVANVIRAISLVRSFEEVDGERVGITGISWGGYLTCLVAGIDPRLKAAVPVYGCGFLHENSAWLDVFAKLPENDRTRWTATFDPSRYLGRCTTPVLFVNGTNDFAYPLDSYRKSYRLVKSPRNLCIRVGMKHSHVHGWEPAEIGLFVDAVLKGAKPLPQFTATRRQGRSVVGTVSTTLPIQEAQLHYTTDQGAWQDRTWKSVPADWSDGQVHATLPDAAPLVYFLTITDKRGALVSSEHDEVGPEDGQ